MRGDCGHEWDIQCACDRRQLRGGPARLLEVTRGEQDLDRSGKNARTGCLWSRVEQRALDGCGGGGVSFLRQAKQRQTWLGLSPTFVRTDVRGLSLIEPTAKPVHLAETVECRPRCRPRHQQLARVLRVAGRLIPPAAHLEDLGAIEEALTAIAHEVRLCGAP